MIKIKPLMMVGNFMLSMSLSKMGEIHFKQAVSYCSYGIGKMVPIFAWQIRLHFITLEFRESLWCVG